MVGVEGGGVPSHGHDAQDAAYPNKIKIPYRNKIKQIDRSPW